MAPKNAQAGCDLDVRNQLAQLLNQDVASIGRVRKTAEVTSRLSVIDVASALTGLDAHNTAEQIRVLFVKHPEVGAKISHFKFVGRGQRDTPVADLSAIIEIIFLLPGRRAAGVRCEAAKIFVRFLGGDLRLVDEVQNLAHVQAFLRENAPEHPLRAFGEAVEAAERGGAAAEMELVLGHRKRMLDLEYETAQKKACSDALKLQAEDRKVQVETYVGCFELVARLGVSPGDRDRLHLLDLVGSELRSSAAPQRKELSVRSFLVAKKVIPKEYETTFGKKLAALKRASLRAAGLPQELPTKTIEVNGQVVQANLYFSEDEGLFEEAWNSLRASQAAPAAAVTLAQAFARSS